MNVRESGRIKWGRAAAALRARPLMDRELPAFETGAAPERPGELFVDWLERAGQADVLDAGAVVLSTVDTDGVPDARVVALRDVELGGGGWVFATDAESPKGTHLGERPVAAMTFYWPAQGRQVRVRGAVEPAPASVSAAEFLARSPASRVASLVGRQSERLDSWAEYDEAARAAEEQLAANADAVPPGHTVYVLWADEVEFWQGARDRRHVRLRYTRALGPDETWTRSLLWP
ncbi:pyridoxine/pyridoxamine 5'-phosphate oxidase [Streptomyces litchfieldiae]|uniref:Pyridoxal 5'-phosphate synthase n=1 Tax=Streptomyces litchfieldiae TaxID=3075543 RepID=A0ABU2MJA4_9ACTN|nr:pyridoxal 5'-phosphate synthase [Streptomyces sp. DSM 44938]MDT0341517.1 pyridoxal 5'-phosphate synthase [Streptomyces sp. DSM 44938]